MKKFSSILFAIILFTVSSCEQEKNNISGQIVISSEFDFNQGTVDGYRFASQEYISFPSNSNIQPDIVVDQFRLLDASLKAGFTSPGNDHGFALLNSFSNMDQSFEFYSNLTNADSTLNFTPTSDTVEQFQIWLLKTSSEQYVKIHVRDIDVIDDIQGPYLDVTIDYYFQQDGRPIFP